MGDFGLANTERCQAQNRTLFAGPAGRQLHSLKGPRTSDATFECLQPCAATTSARRAAAPLFLYLIVLMLLAARDCREAKGVCASTREKQTKKQVADPFRQTRVLAGGGFSEAASPARDRTRRTQGNGSSFSLSCSEGLPSLYVQFRGAHFFQTFSVSCDLIHFISHSFTASPIASDKGLSLA